MELFEAISKRHSYRGAYKQTAVPRADLETIVKAGIMAPSGCNSQSTSFVIIDDQEVLEPIKLLLAGKQRFDSPALIVCVVDPTVLPNGMHFELEDCSAAVENMLLTITAMGYATVWLDGALRGGLDTQIGELLGVPAFKQVRILLPIGVPVAEGKPAHKKPFELRAWYNRYGG